MESMTVVFFENTYTLKPLSPWQGKEGRFEFFFWIELPFGPNSLLDRTPFRDSALLRGDVLDGVNGV